MNQSSRIIGSLIFLAFQPTLSIAQGLISTSDYYERRLREDDVLIRNANGFMGFRPTAFDAFSDATVTKERRLSLAFNFASLHETPERIVAFGDAQFPQYDFQLRDNAQGLDVPQKESAWTRAQFYSRPTDWFFVGGIAHGGTKLNTTHAPGWYHLEQLYTELRLNSLVLSVGRKPIYWGQSGIAPLIFSNNATNMDSIQLATLPVEWPWIFKYLGPLKVEGFVSRMNDERHNAHDYFLGYRLGAMPTPDFEMNGSFAYQFGGRGVDGGNFSDTMVELMGGRVNTGSGIDDASNITNRVLEADFRLHFRDWKWPTSFYTEQHFEDCCGLGNVLHRAQSYIWGVQTYYGSVERADSIRLEYSKIAHKTYYHSTWVQGWTNDGRLMGNPSGRDSQAVHLIIEKNLPQHLQLSSTIYWQQKDRKGRVDRGWIQDYNPQFQKSEQRLVLIPRVRVGLSHHQTIELSSSVARAWNKYSLSGHHTWEWGLYGSYGMEF